MIQKNLASVGLTVITDRDGKIIATVQHPVSTNADAPSLRIAPEDDERAHSITFTADLSAIKNVDEWRQLIRKQLPSYKKSNKETGMSIQEIEQRQANEGAVYEAAKQIRSILDGLAALELPDGRDACEEAVALATE